jgi:hypothetical protein
MREREIRIADVVLINPTLQSAETKHKHVNFVMIQDNVENAEISGRDHGKNVEPLQIWSIGGITGGGSRRQRKKYEPGNQRNKRNYESER